MLGGEQGGFFSLFYLFACCVVIGQVRACMRGSLCVSIFIYPYALNFSGISLSSDENKKGFVIGVSSASIRAANEVEFKAPPLQRPSLIVLDCFPYSRVAL